MCDIAFEKTKGRSGTVNTTFFYKQSIFDPRPKNCLRFSKKLPQKVV